MATTIKEICTEFSKGNFNAVYEHFSDAIQWHIIGGKTITGKEQVTEFCNKMHEEMSSSQLTNTGIIVEGNRVAIEGYCNYTNAENKPAQVQYCDVYHFEQDKIKTITSYCIDSLRA